MTVYSRRAGLLGLLVAGTLLLVACGTSPTSRAPVEERRTAVSRPVMDPNTVAVKQPPGFENAGKVGYYTVKPGETLIRIGLETGQNWKDIARWNNLEQPNQIEVGQVLRVTPPATAVAATESNGVVTRPISSASIASGQVQPGQTSSAAAKPSAAAAAAAEPAAATESGLSWIWPVPGPVLAGFDELKNKGLDLGARLASRCWPRLKGVWSMSAPACAVTATSSSSSTTTPT